ncbi:DUF7282 domain-containing protein [Modicisalibacter radicis]|uniref:DUF7282 domain-containing protein n=1 Tax=Halomonas sp. EAR18 TaxID=2518972 RepID=UPI00109C5CB1|nr:hypothetical protein [Halomonas sp. EAR18]
MNKQLLTGAFLTAALSAGIAQADDTMKVGVRADDQSVAEGTVSAQKVMAEHNGWLVVHRTDDSHKPGPVVGHAPLKKGENTDVAAILTEQVESGDMLMLMLHGEEGGTQTGVFEYTLGAKEDGPVKKDGELVMATITAE